MKRKQIIWALFCCLVFGGFAIYSFFEVHELIVLKKSHELVNGVIEKIEHNSTGKSSTDWLICSYIYNDKTYNKKIFISSGIPFFTSIYNEYQKGETLFMLNYEKDIIFPQNNINMEIRRRLFPLLLFSIGLIISIRVFSK
jgi:hypothetical protein